MTTTDIVLAIATGSEGSTGIVLAIVAVRVGRILGRDTPHDFDIKTKPDLSVKLPVCLATEFETSNV